MRLKANFPTNCRWQGHKLGAIEQDFESIDFQVEGCIDFHVAKRPPFSILSGRAR